MPLSVPDFFWCRPGYFGSPRKFEKSRSSSNFQVSGRAPQPKAEELSFVCIASCTSQTTTRLPTAQMIFALLIRMLMILLTTTIMLIMTLVLMITLMALMTTSENVGRACHWTSRCDPLLPTPYPNPTICIPSAQVWPNTTKYNQLLKSLRFGSIDLWPFTIHPQFVTISIKYVNFCAFIDCHESHNYALLPSNPQVRQDWWWVDEGACKFWQCQ